MPELTIPCFVEDDGHRAFLDALLRRVAGEEGWATGAVDADFRSSVPRIALDPPACGDEALKDFADELRAALRRLRPRQ